MQKLGLRKTKLENPHAALEEARRLKGSRGPQGAPESPQETDGERR